MTALLTIDCKRLAAATAILLALALSCGVGYSQVIGGGGASTGGGGGADGVGVDQVQEEGSSLTKRSTVNFVGSAITCADSGGITVCTLSTSAAGLLTMCDSPTALTIATGAITLSGSAGCYSIDTEASAATDVLSSITCDAGSQFVFLAANDARTVVLDSASYSVYGDTDQSLDQDGDRAFGQCVAANTPIVIGFLDEDGTVTASRFVATVTAPETSIEQAAPGAPSTTNEVHRYFSSVDGRRYYHPEGGGAYAVALNLTHATDCTTVTSITTGVSLLAGDICHEEDADTAYMYDGAAWDSLGGGAGGYATVEDEGTALAGRTVLNFTGSGVTCTDDAGNGETDCDIPSGGPTCHYLTLQLYFAGADGSPADPGANSDLDSGSTSLVNYVDGTVDVIGARFEDADNEIGYWSWGLPDNVDVGGSCSTYVKLWGRNSAGANNVEMQVALGSNASNPVTPTFPGTPETATVAASTTDMKFEFDADDANIIAGETLTLRVERDGANAGDTNTGNMDILRGIVVVPYDPTVAP